MEAASKRSIVPLVVALLAVAATVAIGAADGRVVQGPSRQVPSALPTDSEAGLNVGGSVRYVDGGTGSDSGDCTNEANPCATIVYAIDQGDAGDTIDIADGAYTESIEIDKSLALLGESEAGTIIQAHENPGEADSRVITVVGDFGLDVANVTIRHGVADGCGGELNPDVDCGGGLLNVSATLALTNVTFSRNRSEIGGGMANFHSSPALTGVTFRENVASSDAGGMENQFDSSPTLHDVAFIGNISGNKGGGMHNQESSSPTLTNVIFEGNTASFLGGGMANDPRSSSPTLVNVTFSENTAQGGGGMFNTTSSPTLENVTFSGNTASGGGGGIGNFAGSSPTLVNVVFIGNHAGPIDGGGMGNVVDSSPTLTNVTFHGNTTEGSGGGMFSSGNSSPLVLTNVIVWGNTAEGEGNEIYNSGSASTILHYSLYRDEPGDIVEGGGFTAENSLTDDPLFVDAGNGNLRLAEGSPAIDAGDPNTDLGIFPTDKDGDPIDLDSNPRVFGDEIDIGAYENQGTMPVLAFEPSSLDFGEVAVGSTSLPQTAALQNIGSGDATGLTFSPTGGGFEADTSACADTLLAGASCEVSVTFTPAEPGAASAVLEVTSDQDASVGLGLSGTGVSGGPVTIRYVDGDTGLDIGDCTNEANPCATIGYALDQADAGNTIAIADGEYTESFEIDKSLNLQGESEAGTIIQAHENPGAADRRVITIDGDLEVEIADLTIRHGVATTAFPPESGGGLFNRNATLTVANVTFSENAAQGSGGGLYIIDSPPMLTDVTINGNTAAIYGGGMYMFNSGSSAELTNVTFSGNEAGDLGGGMLNQNSSPSLMNVTFSENTAENSGGGMGNISDSSPTLTNVMFIGNEAGDWAGGMGNAFNSSPELTNVTFSGNEAGLLGGGMYNVLGSSATLTNTILWGNTAAMGNEIFNDDIGGGPGSTILHYSLYSDGPGDIEGPGGFEAENSLTDAPLFVDAENGNLRLTESSPAIDTGDPATNLGIFPTDENGDPIDLDGNPRVFGDEIDIGAYENQGTMPVLTFEPSSLDFGEVEVGSTSLPQTVTLQNIGGGDATGLTFGPTGGGFEVDTSACGDTLSAGASCAVSVTLTPIEPGPASATLEVTSDQDASAGLSLAGTGVSAGVVTPVALEVDPEALLSDGNGVFEPGELIEVAPAWRNDGLFEEALTGTASSFNGPDGANYLLPLDDADYGNVEPGATASCLDTGVCYWMGVNDPAVRPATHWQAVFDETFSEGTTKTWSLHIGDSFVDVPRTNPFYPAVETLLHHGVTGGCTATEYCPTGTNTRGQMAVFLLKAAEGGEYAPPACEAGQELFADVPFDSPLCPWIEELAARQVTSGCGGGNYCPGSPVTRAQMAVFLLKAFEGGGYTPPECTGGFTDVPCPSTFAAWIEELAARGITGGCGSEPPAYCPAAPVTRQQMAVFVTKTFGLTLYGP